MDRFAGNIDEVIVYSSALTAAQVKAAAMLTHVCPSTAYAASLHITASNYGIYCLPQAVTDGGAATPNFGKETTPESVKFGTILVVPTGGDAAAVSGTFTGFSGGSYAWWNQSAVMTPEVRARNATRLSS